MALFLGPVRVNSYTCLRKGHKNVFSYLPGCEQRNWRAGTEGDGHVREGCSFNQLPEPVYQPWTWCRQSPHRGRTWLLVRRVPLHGGWWSSALQAGTWGRGTTWAHRWSREDSVSGVVPHLEGRTVMEIVWKSNLRFFRKVFSKANF